MDNEKNCEAIIYGMNTTKSATAVDVRDGIIKCFVEAHSEELAELKNYGDVTDEDFEKIKSINVEGMIKNIFKEIDEDFDNPTKESLVKVVGKLAEFAKNFRNQEIVKRHYDQVMCLINLIK